MPYKQTITCYGPLLSNSCTSYSSTFTEVREGRRELNLMILNVVLLPSPCRHPVSGFLKQSIAQSFRSFVCFLINARSHCSMEWLWQLHSAHLHQHARRGGMIGKRTIWSVSKSGSALHVATRSNIAECALSAWSSRVSIIPYWTQHR